MGGLASKVDEVLAEIPMKEAVRYKKGNLKWTRSDVKSHSEALACGLLELGCKVGYVHAVRRCTGGRGSEAGIRRTSDRRECEPGKAFVVSLPCTFFR